MYVCIPMLTYMLISMHACIHMCICVCVHTFQGSEGCQNNSTCIMIEIGKICRVIPYRYCKDFIYIVMDHLYIKIHQQCKRSVYLIIFNGTVNCVFSFIRPVRWSSKLLQILMPAWYALCTHELLKNFLGLFTVKYISESTYWLGTGKISNFLSRLLHEVLSHATTIILTVFFCKINTFLLLEELPQEIVPYFIL
jgi:hypothetical protein